MQLTDPLTTALLKTTEAHIAALSDMGIRTVYDMLFHLPRTYDDVTSVMTLQDAPLNEKVTLRGTIHSLKLVHTRSGKKLVQGQFRDTEGDTAEVVWFNQPHILRMLHDGEEVSFVGKVQEDGYKLKIMSPTCENAIGTTLLHSGRIVPIYPQTEQISSKWFREKIFFLKDAFSLFKENLPSSVLEEEQFPSRGDALFEVHFPSTPDMLARARERLSFEEMYLIQLDALTRRESRIQKQNDRLKMPMDPLLIRGFFASQSFTPTGDQKVAIFEILKDMELPHAMSRLLEGDVGSGKTLVAAAVMAHTIYHGGQCALLVPTEVLARQHLTTISRLLLQFYEFVQKGKDAWGEHDLSHLVARPLPRVELLTGSLAPSDADRVRQGVASGLVDVLIGTHAIIQDSVSFPRLLLAIIDEQHRFGVEQREALLAKGDPHFLSMTATPIPRTLALTAYGEHDLSVLLTKPGQRKKIITKVVPPSERHTVERFIDLQIHEGRQVYVICPFISESKSDEFAEVRNVEAELERLRTEFPHRRIAALHGKMSSEEKEEIMASFKNHDFDILVSTSVIEVGIDVPNSTLIVIEGAERFGLSQLHQFRGRVGRSDHQSYCYLFTTKLSQKDSDRLRAMEEHDSGFMLAEIDLQLRGPGQMFGVRQSGIPDTHFGGLLNPELVVRARKAAGRELKMKNEE